MRTLVKRVFQMLSCSGFITHILFTATKLHYGYFMQVIKLARDGISRLGALYRSSLCFMGLLLPGTIVRRLVRGVFKHDLICSCLRK